jgi:hypothetical protein
LIHEDRAQELAPVPVATVRIQVSEAGEFAGADGDASSAIADSAIDEETKRPDPASLHPDVGRE